MLFTYEKNKKIVRESADIWITKDFDQVYKIYDSHCIHHQQKNHQNVKIIGIDNWKQCMLDFLIQYPDYQEKITTQIAENDRVVSILECHAANIAWSGVVIDRIENDKIKETWVWFKRNS